MFRTRKSVLGTVIPPPPSSEQPLQVPYNEPKGGFGDLSPYVTVDVWEWSTFRILNPRMPPCFFLDGNSRIDTESGEQGHYIRFTEGRGRHTLARYLHQMRAAVLSHLAGEPWKPIRPCRPVRLLDGDPCNLLPSNRGVHSDSVPPGAPSGTKRRRGINAERSLTVRFEAVVLGQDPEAAWLRQFEKLRNR